MFTEAEKILVDLLSTSPQNREYQFCAGMICFELKKLDDAEKYADSGIKAHDKNPRFLKLKAKIEIEKRNYAKAIDLLDDASDIDSEDLDTWLLMAKAAKLRLQFKVVVKAASEALDLDEKNIEAYRYKCDGLLQMLHYDKAVKCYDQWFKLDPKNEEALRGKEESTGRLAESKSQERMPVNRMNTPQVSPR